MDQRPAAQLTPTLQLRGRAREQERSDRCLLFLAPFEAGAEPHLAERSEDIVKAKPSPLRCRSGTRGSWAATWAQQVARHVAEPGVLIAGGHTWL
jgi:hypothetical protein